MWARLADGELSDDKLSDDKLSGEESNSPSTFWRGRCSRRSAYLLPMIIAVQFAGLLGICIYLAAFVNYVNTINSHVVQEFLVDSTACPIQAGNPVSFVESGAVRPGAGTSLYRAASQVFLSEVIVSHAMTALGTDAIVAAFSCESGANYLTVGLKPDGMGGAGVDDLLLVWLDFIDLGAMRPDALVAMSNSTFVVAGGGFAAVGTLTRLPSAPWSSDVELSPASRYDFAESSINSGAARSTPSRLRARPAASDADIAAVTVLSPSTIAVSYRDSGADRGGNATLVTRIGTIDGGRRRRRAASTASGLPSHAPGLNPFSQLTWGPPAVYSVAHMSHAITAVTSDAFLLAYPMDDGTMATEANGAPLTVRLARILPAPDGSPYASSSVQLLGSAVLHNVRAHYLFAAAAVTPTQAIIAFVDARLNDGVRAVLVTLTTQHSPSRGGAAGASFPTTPTFGTTLVLNSGAGGAGVDTAAGLLPWLHLSLKPLAPPLQWWKFDANDEDERRRVAEAAAAAPRRRRRAGTRAAQRGRHVRLPAAGVSDAAAARTSGEPTAPPRDSEASSSPSHNSLMSPGHDREGSPFALIYSDLSNAGRVTVVTAHVTPSADMVLTSPSFVVSDPSIPQDSSMVQQPGRRGLHGGGQSEGDDPAVGYFWVSATVWDETQLLTMDTWAAADAVQRTSGAADASRPALRLATKRRRGPSRGGHADGGLAMPPIPSYVISSANISLLHALHNPVGVALNYGACGGEGSSVRVLMGGLYDYSGGIPQVDAGGGSALLGPAEAAADDEPPLIPGKAYFADTSGRLIEGSYAGYAGAGFNGAGGYVSAPSSSGGGSSDPDDDEDGPSTSVSYASYVGVAISGTQLLVRPGQ